MFTVSVVYEVLPRLMGNRGIMSFISGEHKSKTEGNRRTKVILGSREHRKNKIFITKTYLYNFDPLKSHYYIEKLWFTGVYIIFFISAQKHGLWVLVRTASARQF